MRDEPFSHEELTRHDAFLAKYFVAGGAFLVLGSAHMVSRTCRGRLSGSHGAATRPPRPRPLEHACDDRRWRHAARDRADVVRAATHRRRPLASNGMAQFAFWLTAVGLTVFYVALVGDGIAMSRLVAARVGVSGRKGASRQVVQGALGIGAGIMGLGYWCFAANVLLTVFQARLVRVPKPQTHLWKFLATGALALTVGTVQGVIQVTPAQRGLALSREARGRVDRPHQPRAHQSRHRLDDARRRRAVRARAAARRRRAVRRHANTVLVAASSAARSRSTHPASTSASTRAASSSAAG